MNKGVNTETSWLVKQATPLMAVAQMTKNGIIADIYSKSTVSSIDTLIGRAVFKIENLIYKQNEIIDLKADLHLPNGKPTDSTGKCTLKARYLREFSDATVFPDPGIGDQTMNEQKQTPTEPLSSVKKQLQKDLANEKDLILAALEAQNKLLNTSLGNKLYFF